MAFLLKAIGFSDSIPGFPFTPVANDPGRTVYTSPQMCWTVRSGTQSGDAQVRVSIFTCAVSSVATTGTSGSRELVKRLAQNAMRRSKSLMIPGFLKCHGAVEYGDTVYIATEPCVALKDVLESPELRRRYYGQTKEEYIASVAYGLDTVCGALAALQSNRLVHGNVNCGSIFVSAASGFWRLFGLELVSSADEVEAGDPGCLFESARRARMVVGYRCPPELGSSGGGDAGGGDPVVAVDAWGLACLLYETMGVRAEEAINGKLNALAHSLSAAELPSMCRQSLPKSLQQCCGRLTAPNPRTRTSVASFIESCVFVKDNSFVQCMKALSELLLMDLSEQVRLVESLTEQLKVFPLRACLCFVLPRLGELVRTAAKSRGGSNVVGVVSIGPVVDPVLKIAERTAAGEDFDTYVTPVLIQLYRSTDVLLRYRLLVGAEVYGAKLSSPELNNVIWPLYVKGFSHSAPSVREYSARALVHLAPHLSENILSEQVPKALAQLQRDPDGAMRANATIALHLISGHITPPSQRAVVMLTYCRPMLRDAFEPSRVAALRSLHGVLECFSGKQIAELVLPATSPLAIDPTAAESRTAALSLLKASISRLEKDHQRLSAQQSAAAAGSPACANGSTVASPANSTAPAAAPAGAASVVWGLLGGFTTPFVSSSTGPAVQHVDTDSTPVPSRVGSPPRSLPAVSVLTTPVAAAASLAGGGSGWSDDDDDAGAAGEDDGWGDIDSGEGKLSASRVSPSLTKTAASSSSVPTASASTGADVVPIHPPFSAGNAPAPPSSAMRFASSPLPQPHTTAWSPTGLSSSTSNSRPAVAAGMGKAAPLAGSHRADSANTSAPSGPMKLRKKGGLGAARLD
ncbi:hypothetical protein JKF63_05071 [Porcisia hertigi]|uniref:Uncharacterized protein n=1 Tax=Porcisia hertigi TaxID=2761500 RepID=A0A836IW40_9TRYP|nr:hypothetical protein JKF63_05071 [Porcisia hertigi]